MNNVSHIRSFQQRIAQSQAAKAGLKPTDQAHWDKVAERIDEPEIARMIVVYFERTAPAMKVQQPGLYLRAKMVLANDFLAHERAAREARVKRLRSLARGLGGIVYFSYRCLRLPVRALRDLVALMIQRRQSNRPLFHH